MTRKIYTYTSIESISHHPRYAEIMASPQITATADLLKAMSVGYPDMDRAFDVHEIQKLIIEDWENEQTAFQQHIVIGSILRKMNVPTVEKSVYDSFVKNKRDVLNGIRLLVEADVYPNQLTPINIEERLFKAIWEKIEEEDSSFGRFRATMSAYLHDSQLFQRLVESISDKFSESTIILHGFYFITPIQERVFDMLESCGKELIFLSCIDTTILGVEEIWCSNFSESKGYPPVEKWITDSSVPLRNRPFGSAFESALVDSNMDHASIIRYDTEMDFIDDIKRLLKDDYSVFSVDVKATESLLKEFYPERFKRYHLLSFPVGQYIYRLHSMWQPMSQRLELSIDDVQTCFASGWVVKDGANGSSHMEGLELLQTYVSDCRSIEDWSARLEFLKETKSKVAGMFEGHITENLNQNRRWHRIMSNPLLNFGCFSYDENKLDELIALIHHLIDTARELFSNEHEIDIAEHLNKVKRLISQKNGDNELLEEEHVILKALLERLSFRNLGISKCLPGEISEAMMLIIGGGVLDDENYAFQSAYNESFIRPLYQIESAPLTANNKIHLCLADENRLPGKTKPYIWPITDEMLNRLKIDQSSQSQRYIADMRFIIKSSALANRYLFFSLLQNKEVEISWIANEDNKDIGASPYVNILKSIFNVPVNRYRRNEWTEEIISQIESAEATAVLDVSLNTIIADEPVLDLMLCPWRFIYGYVLNDHPTYVSDFHYNFALSRMIGAFRSPSGFSRKQIAEEVLKLFPYLREVEKQQIIDHANNNTNNSSDSLDSISYPRARLLIHYLTKKTLDTANQRLQEKLEQNQIFSVGLNEIECTECMFCPFVGQCPHAEKDTSKEVI
ncbi:MAG: hypothetical protein Q8S24_01060 [Eubacteriales bacterium]|nr:hypothetical protein [Eubacteriales bacterium]